VRTAATGGEESGALMLAGWRQRCFRAAAARIPSLATQCHHRAADLSGCPTRELSSLPNILNWCLAASATHLRTDIPVLASSR